MMMMMMMLDPMLSCFYFNSFLEIFLLLLTLSRRDVWHPLSIFPTLSPHASRAYPPRIALSVLSCAM
eukprot:m.75845 g.75845  ORF g.75845 m.75845 type:complete len:67 (+) comp7839_c0_seq1:2-202(+)